jgi:hypothetical protein
MPQRGEARCQESAAGANLQDVLIAVQLQGLQDPTLDRRRHHGLPVTERDFHVCECERLVPGRHEALALGRRECFEYVCIEDRPGSHLLVDHLSSGIIDIHSCVPGFSCSRCASVA